jgi:hypothetical protein
MQGLVRTLHTIEKQSPVIEPDESVGQLAIQANCPPIWNPDKGLYEWWTAARYSAAPHGPSRVTTIKRSHFATSTDGLNWERPSLGLYEWNGSKDNNIAADPDNLQAHDILRDDRDPDRGRRYKGMFGGGHREFGVSPDGFDWTMLDVPGVPSEDTSHMLYDEYTEQFLLYHKHSTEWGRSVWLSTCKEFGDWSEAVLVFHSDEVDKQNAAKRIQAVVDDPDYLTPPIIDEQDYIAQIYKMAVMPYEGLYVGFPVLYNPSGLIPPPRGNATGISQVELTVSRDLYNWDRVADRAVFIPLDKWDGVNYGTCQVLTCGRPVVRDDGEIWVYYNADRARGHKQLYWYSQASSHIDRSYFNDSDESAIALCLGKVRPQGFVSLDAETQGTLVTAPFVLESGDLRVNVEAQHGEFRAEVVDAETMERLPGLSQADCDPVRGDELRGKLTWQGRPVPAREKPVRLRFVISRAKLYAFWLGE